MALHVAQCGEDPVVQHTPPPHTPLAHWVPLRQREPAVSRATHAPPDTVLGKKPVPHAAQAPVTAAHLEQVEAEPVAQQYLQDQGWEGGGSGWKKTRWGRFVGQGAG